ncbi:unnamed protein product [Umbelopsis vinacea]
MPTIGKSNKANAKGAVSQPKSSVEIDDIFSKKKANSEIDDIFAKKPTDKQFHSETIPSSTTGKAKKEKKASNNEPDEVDDSNAESSSKAVQEVVFAELAAVKASKKRTVQPKIADDDGFSDSRGKKAKRTTEDGYPLYDVKELNIGLGGDTDECPFDCTCCF